MKNPPEITEAQLLRLDYEQRFAFKVEALKQKRKDLHISQSDIAEQSGCSLRKIQLFEQHKSLDAFLIYVYKNCLL